jgi:hypothetical protein
MFIGVTQINQAAKHLRLDSFGWNIRFSTHAALRTLSRIFGGDEAFKARPFPVLSGLPKKCGAARLALGRFIFK